MLLAGDVGGTKTLLGLFAPAAERPTAIEVGEFVTLDYNGLDEMIREFLGAWKVEPRTIAARDWGRGRGHRPGGAAHQRAVAGRHRRDLERDRPAARAVVNDLEALAFAVPVLEPDELAVLQQGVAVPGGNAAVIAAGTGLGISMLHEVDGRLVPIASEGGHADFAARTPRELDLVRDLTRVFGRVGVEHVISGPGLVNVYQFTHQAFGAGPDDDAKHADAVARVRRRGGNG